VKEIAMSENNLSIVLAYYEAINQSNPILAAEKLADNVQIISPLATRTGKVDVAEALKGFCSAVERVTVTAKFTSENQVMLAYDMLFPKPIGNLRAAGLLNVDHGLITSIELFYDGQAVMSKKDQIFSSSGK
jgi:hypothetical protein